MAEPTRLKNMRVKPDHDTWSFGVKLQNIIKAPPKFEFPPIFPLTFHRNLLATFNIKRSFPQTNPSPQLHPAAPGAYGV